MRRPNRQAEGGAVLIGYARVSTDDQNLDMQRDALHAAGCCQVYCDGGVSGAVACRPELTRALAALRPGDILVTWKLDRLGRSLRNLIDILTLLEERGIGFRSLSEAIDTTTAGGRLIFHVMGALAEFERSLISERTKAGMAAARARGRVVGRQRKLTPDQVDAIRGAVATGNSSPADLAAAYGVSLSTIRRALVAS